MLSRGEQATAELRNYMMDLPHQLAAICKEVLDDPRFVHSPGGATRHHAYIGGLAVHTLEVVRLAVAMAHGCVGQKDDLELVDIVTTAAILHDYGKIHEYIVKEDGTIGSLPFKNLIGHLVWSAIWFAENSTQVFEPYRERIMHAMLAHHGRLEWRSPVEPQTIEAHILHAADMTSMQLEGNEDKKPR